MQVVHLPEDVEVCQGCGIRILPDGWLIPTYQRKEQWTERPVVIRPGQNPFFHAKRGLIGEKRNMPWKGILGYEPVNKVKNPHRQGNEFLYPREPFIPFDERGMVCSESEAAIEKETRKENKDFIVRAFWPVQFPLDDSTFSDNIRERVVQVAAGIAAGGLIIIRKSDYECKTLEIKGGACDPIVSRDGLTILCYNHNTIYILDNELA